MNSSLRLLRKEERKIKWQKRKGSRTEMADKQISKLIYKRSVKNVFKMVLEDNIPLIEAINKTYGKLNLVESDSKKYVHINKVKELKDEDIKKSKSN